MKEFIETKLMKITFCFLFTRILKFYKKYKRKDGRMIGKYGLEIDGKWYIMEYELFEADPLTSKDPISM